MRGNGNTMISIGDTVKVSYIGYLADGTIFDSTEMHGGRLLEFEVGSGQMIPGFDLAVSQMEVGESRTVSIPCDMAYGEYRKELIETVPCLSFPHWEDLPVGEYVVLNTSEGPFRMKILKIQDGLVHVDRNHELAGKDISFDITVVEAEKPLSAVEQERHGSGCACGCDVLREQIDGDRGRKAECGCEHD